MKYFFVPLSGIVMITTLWGSCNNEAVKTETPGFNLDSAKAAIASGNKVFGSGFVAGDSTAFANCYTGDGCIYNSNMPKLCGSQAIGGKVFCICF